MTNLYLGAVGNGETVALMGPGFGVDWLCVPSPDSFPVFARALDPARGGTLALQFMWAGTLPAPEQVAQRYLGRTNILETSARFGDLAVRVVDYMPWGKRHLTRRITLTNTGTTSGEAKAAFVVLPTASVSAPPELMDRVHVAFKEHSRGELAPGESLECVLVMGYGDTADEARQAWEAAAADDLAYEERFWAEWLAPARPVHSGDPALDDAYYRSLLALKLLCNEQTGAILAAPTASFPAIPGGGDNWDYRYAWLRDGYFIARCLDNCGLHGESRRFYDFALAHQAADGRWHQTLYTVTGNNPAEFEVPDMTGPGGEVPIRFGNAASTQIQIDGEPNLLHGLWCHWQATGELSFIRDRWEPIRKAAEAVMTTWQWQENGIWEIRERLAHWTYGKALCSAGLRAAADMARALGSDAEAERWGAEAERIRQDVLAGGWSAEREAFLQTYDDESPVDISVLALSLWGLLPACDPRMVSTVRLMEEPLQLPQLDPDREYSTDTPLYGVRLGGLSMWGGMARYDYAAVPFYLPTLWLARYYRLAGQRERALELIRLCLRSATGLGLMAEHFDPRDSGQWGNFPQGFSHEETALALLELFGEPAIKED